MNFIGSYEIAITEEICIPICFEDWLDEKPGAVLLDTTVITVEPTTSPPLVVNEFLEGANKSMNVFVSGGVANTTYTVGILAYADDTRKKQLCAEVLIGAVCDA